MHDCGKSNLEKQQEKVRQQVALLNKLANYYMILKKKMFSEHSLQITNVYNTN